MSHEYGAEQRPPATAPRGSGYIPREQGNGPFAIHIVRTGHFCKRRTRLGFPHCLNAADAAITADAEFAITEPILHREIHCISYMIDDARVYDTVVLALASATLVNPVSAVLTKRLLNLGYENEEMSTWDSTMELKLVHHTIPPQGTVSQDRPRRGGHHCGSRVLRGVRHYDWG
ncbi:hypothetical protein ZWY2020_031554 [Hordeum vulgare]|nr:hypothetical protein ZWY2020_031554 [Hordeum vulgare]